MTTTIQDTGETSAQQVDYGELDAVQTLAAAASNPEEFEALIDAALREENGTASNPEVLPKEQVQAQQDNVETHLTPDYEAQLRELQNTADERERRNAELQQQLAVLQAQIALQNSKNNPSQVQMVEQPKANADKTQLPQLSIDPTLFGDLSETSMANGVKQAIEQAIPYLREQVRAQAAQEAQKLVEQSIEPVVQQQNAQAANAHQAAILAKHPDANEALASKEFREWVHGLPSFSKQAVLGVIEQGTTEQVVEMFDVFKTTLPAKHKAVVQTVPAALPAVPLSLSQVQGSAPSTDPLAALGSASGEAQLAQLGAMPAAQVEALMEAAQRAMLH